MHPCVCNALRHVPLRLLVANARRTTLSLPLMQSRNDAAHLASLISTARSRLPSVSRDDVYILIQYVFVAVKAKIDKQNMHIC